MRVSKDAEIVDLGKQVELDYSHLKGKENRKRVEKANEAQKKNFQKKRVKADNANSYATEAIHKNAWEKDRASKDPGFTPGKLHSFSSGSCWDENGKLKRKGA